jgi:hypothetical protein
LGSQIKPQEKNMKVRIEKYKGEYFASYKRFLFWTRIHHHVFPGGGMKPFPVTTMFKTAKAAEQAVVDHFTRVKPTLVKEYEM